MAAKVVPSVIVNELLNKDNYEDWSFQVEVYFLAKGLMDTVKSTSKPRIVGTKFEEWSKINAEALHAIHICCGKEVFPLIRGINTAKEAWDTLAERLQYKDDDNTDLESYESDNHTSRDGDTEPAKELDIENAEPGEELDIVNAEPKEEETKDDDNADLESYESDNHTSRDGDTEPAKELDIENAEPGEELDIVNAEPKEEETKDYKPFFAALDTLKWNAVMEFVGNYPEAVRKRARLDGMTALHNAVTAGNVAIVKQLVKFMTEEDLEILNSKGGTALDCCYLSPEGDTEEMLEIARCLVGKNQKLLVLVHPKNKKIPLLNAYIKGRSRLTRYLYSVTPLGSNDSQAAELISRSLRLKRFDIAWDLIKQNPSLAFAKNISGTFFLIDLASMPSAFLSGIRLNFWERWIYEGIPAPRDEDSFSTVNHKYQNQQRHLIYHDIHQMKYHHARILGILRCICGVLESKKQDRLVQRAIFRAVERGHIEFITIICDSHQRFFMITDEHEKTMFQFAAECRQEKNFNLIYKFDRKTRKVIACGLNDFGNNMLHVVGNLSSSPQISHIRGAALQMQKELKWFKKVESIAGFKALGCTNSDGLTPPEVFTMNHSSLVKRAELSMKETATSSSALVGALIVTIMFAAALTVPGGINQDTGIPIYLDTKAFTVFIIADAISLCSATTSVMIFLGILTSRFAEQDFLISLPIKLILGLFTLFLSIAAMMIAFSSAIFIMLPGKLSIVIPCNILATVPIASFLWMQFSFLLEIIISTYGSKIYTRKVQRFI